MRKERERTLKPTGLVLAILVALAIPVFVGGGEANAQRPRRDRTLIGCAGVHTLSNGLLVTVVDGVGLTEPAAREVLQANAETQCDKFCKSRDACPGQRKCRRIGHGPDGAGGASTSEPVCFVAPVTGRNKCVAFLTSCECGCLVRE